MAHTFFEKCEPIKAILLFWKALFVMTLYLQIQKRIDQTHFDYLSGSNPFWSLQCIDVDWLLKDLKKIALAKICWP